jgi:hypothetical protein
MELTREAISTGFWKEMAPGKDLKGFHISQMMSPRAKMVAKDGKGIYQKMINYPTAKFYNEVLGLSYEYADRLVSDADLDAIMDNEYTFYDRLPEWAAQNKVYMGVDWGTGEKSYTVVTIFTFNKDGKYQMLYCKKYDQGNELNKEEQVMHIMRLIRLFRVSLAVVDWGFGYTEIQKLRREFGFRIGVCYYTHQQKEKVVYDSGKEIYKTRRTDIIMDYITDMIHHRRGCWPGNERAGLEFLRKHHLAEQAEYRTSLNGRSEEMFLNHPGDFPDDGLHSCVYAYLAFLLDTGGIQVVRGVNRTPLPEPEFYSVQSR